MSLKDIEKLKEKIEKDPNSKLFVPLSEEYKKAGMLDEAISVLLIGIQGQPGYMSARVALGKIYLEKEMLKEAQSEFEQVIQAIPDNLYAHKKLAEIYRSTGNTEQAIRSYKAVLKLNTMDDDALINLNNIESSESGFAEEETPASPSAPEEPLPVEEVPSEIDAGHIPAALSPAAEEAAFKPINEDELAAFHSAMFGEASDNENASPEDLVTQVEADEDLINVIEDPTETETAEEDEFGVFDLEEPAVEEHEETVAASQAISDEIVTEPEIVKESEPQKKTGVTTDDADKYISEGRYIEAFRVYKTFLAANPDDKKILQSIEELGQLMKMTGKDREALTGQLNNFLEGINKRRDEFYRNT